jgi:hypothetical protein
MAPPMSPVTHFWKNSKYQMDVCSYWQYLAVGIDFSKLKLSEASQKLIEKSFKIAPNRYSL